ncbi:MAG: glycosyltransferase family 4 protein [FCB group bacterium]|jgi:glycosyltransferase involved in cell wall biosynthesis|nr:glycosyltransferase family 4 protein [FCB group bacterium]
MRILQLHNRYRYVSGENRMFDATVDLLRRRGHEVCVYERSSGDIQGSWGRICALRQGAYSRAAKLAFASLLAEARPELVHVHNLFPLISPSVLEACREAGVPVVLRCPNYRLECPTGAHIRRGRVCERCRGGREYWCALTNCRGNVLESAAFAARGYSTRRRGIFAHNVTRYVPPSEFVRRRLTASGIPEGRVRVVPNTVGIPQVPADPAKGEYALYVGRLGSEKGIEVLLDAAAIAGVPVRIAGDGPLAGLLAKKVPSNVTHMGRLVGKALDALFRGARMILVPSICQEAFGLAAAEGMAYGLPAVASSAGGLPEVVDDEVTGLLVRPGDAEDLAGAMRELWSAPKRCAQMGANGRAKARQEYSEDVYYNRLMALYADAMTVEERT